MTLDGRDFCIVNHVILGKWHERTSKHSDNSAGSVESTCLFSCGWRDFRTPFMLMLGVGRKGLVIHRCYWGVGYSDGVTVSSFVTVASRCGADSASECP